MKRSDLGYFKVEVIPRQRP